MPAHNTNIIFHKLTMRLHVILRCSVRTIAFSPRTRARQCDVDSTTTPSYFYHNIVALHHRNYMYVVRVSSSYCHYRSFAFCYRTVTRVLRALLKQHQLNQHKIIEISFNHYTLYIIPSTLYYNLQM